MRDDISEVPYEQMDPVLRALIAYESTGALDVAEPQALIDEVRHTTPVIRWELGVGLFLMDDIVAAGRDPKLVATHPDTGTPFGMGSDKPLIPLHLDGDLHRHYRRLLDPLFTPKKMALLEPDIRKLADELVDGFISDDSVELHGRVLRPLPSTIFLTLFGMPLEDMPLLNRTASRTASSRTRATPARSARSSASRRASKCRRISACGWRSARPPVPGSTTCWISSCTSRSTATR